MGGGKGFRKKKKAVESALFVVQLLATVVRGVHAGGEKTQTGGGIAIKGHCFCCIFKTAEWGQGKGALARGKKGKSRPQRTSAQERP